MADDKCHLSFNILETKEATKNLTADVTITSKALMDYQKRNILRYPFIFVETPSEYTTFMSPEQ